MIYPNSLRDLKERNGEDNLYTYTGNRMIHRISFPTSFSDPFYCDVLSARTWNYFIRGFYRSIWTIILWKLNNSPNNSISAGWHVQNTQSEFCFQWRGAVFWRLAQTAVDLHEVGAIHFLQTLVASLNTTCPQPALNLSCTPCLDLRGVASCGHIFWCELVYWPHCAMCGRTWCSAVCFVKAVGLAMAPLNRHRNCKRKVQDDFFFYCRYKIAFMLCAVLSKVKKQLLVVSERILTNHTKKVIKLSLSNAIFLCLHLQLDLV